MNKTMIRAAVMTISASASAFLASMPVYADPSSDMAATTSTISDAISNASQQIWTLMTSIVSPLAALVIAACGIILAIGGAKDGDAAKHTLIRVIIAMAIVLLAPMITSMIKSWFINSSSWSTYM